MEGDQLESYFHLRIPTSEPTRRTAADADLTIDFLEPLSQDPFKGEVPGGPALLTVNCCGGWRQENRLILYLVVSFVLFILKFYQ